MPPGLMHDPVGQLGLESNAPVSEVTLWIDWPVFVHETVEPAATVIVAGEKPKSTIDTCAVVAASGGGTGWDGSFTGAAGAAAIVVVVVVAVVVVAVGAVVVVGRVAADAVALIDSAAPITKKLATHATLSRLLPSTIVSPGRPIPTESRIRTRSPMRSTLPTRGTWAQREGRGPLK